MPMRPKLILNGWWLRFSKKTHTLAITARLLYVHGVREDTLGGIADGW
jgi:hypothetical protein